MPWEVKNRFELALACVLDSCGHAGCVANFKLGDENMEKAKFLVLLLALAYFFAGCTTTDEKIYRAMDRVAWAPRESEVWNEGLETMKALDRMALRNLLKRMDDAWYIGKYGSSDILTENGSWPYRVIQLQRACG
jgi:hypothetical protein